MKAGSECIFKVNAVHTENGKTYRSADSTAVKITVSSVPAAPANLRAEENLPGFAYLSWDASAGASAYAVLKYSTKTGGYTEIGRTASCSYTDKGLSPTVSYYYRVCAVLRESDGETTSPAAGVKFTASSYPMTPENVRTAVGEKTVTLSWDPVQGGVTYEILRYSTKEKDYVPIATTKKLSYQVTDVFPGHTYYFRIRALYESSDSVYLSFPTKAIQAYPPGFGDVSGDGVITAEDARLALRAAVGLESFTPGSPPAKSADATGDGAITAEDARAILRVSVGLPVT